MSHSSELQKELDKARADLATCESQVDGLVRDLKIAITTGAAEHDVEQLQVSKDTINRKRERLQLALEHLESKRPEAAKADATERLPALVKSLSKQAKALSETYQNLSVAIAAVEKAVTDIEEAQKQASEWSHLSEEVDFLCQQHGLEKPTLPTLPEFPHALISRNWTRRGRLPTAQQRLEDSADIWKPRMTKAERNYLAGIGPKPKQAA